MPNDGVGPRVPKDDFMRALGLDPSDARHEGVYRTMRDEAIAVYTQLNADRSSLLPEKRNDSSVQQPFFWHHITRERQQWAVMTTWQNAQAGTVQRILFDRGATTGEHAPNWVTLWLLYSVFRSRDIRNNRSRRAGDGNGGRRELSITSTELATSDDDVRTTDGNTERRIYDPARNIYRPRR